MWFKKKAINITGPVSPEVQQQMELEQELNQIRQESQTLQKSTGGILSELNTTRLKHADLLKRVNELSEQMDMLESYVDAHEKVLSSGGNIDIEKWHGYLTSVNPELAGTAKDMDSLLTATQKEIQSLAKKREFPLQELQDRHTELADKSYTLITELNGFQKQLKKYIFKDSKGFFAGMATISPEFASNLLNDVNLSDEERKDLELTISKTQSGELPVSFEIEVSTLRDIVRSIEDTIQNQEIFLTNATSAIQNLQKSPVESTAEIEALEKAMQSVSTELESLVPKFEETKSKLIKLENLYNKHILQPLKTYIEAISKAAIKAIPAGASKETRETLLQIIKEGLTAELQSDSPTSLTPQDVEKMVQYAEKKGKLQSKYLLPLIVDHFLVGKLHEDIPDLSSDIKELPDEYKNIENSIQGWVFDIGRNTTKSLKETIRQLYLSQYAEVGEQTLNSKFSDFISGKEESLSKPEKQVFKRLQDYVGQKNILTGILNKIGQDFNVDSYIQQISLPTYSGFTAIQELAQELYKKKTGNKETLDMVTELTEDVNDIKDPTDSEVSEVISAIDTLNLAVSQHLGLSNTFDAASLTTETFLDYKDSIIDWLDSLEKQISSVTKIVSKDLDDLLIFIDKSDYNDVATDLEALMYAYSTNSTMADGGKVINNINKKVDRIASILDSKLKSLADEMKDFGLSISDAAPEDFILSLLHKNESVRGPRGIRETVVPSGLVKKQHLSKEKFMKYSANELVSINGSTGVYRIVATSEDKLVIVPEDELQSGTTAAPELVDESDVFRPLSTMPAIGDMVVDETYGECQVVSAHKANSVDILLKSGVRIYDYPLHKLSSDATPSIPEVAAHQCYMDGGWSIDACCSFSKKDEAGIISCGYREAVEAEQKLTQLSKDVSLVDSTEEMKQVEILKVSKLLESTPFETISNSLSVKSNINVLDPIFTPLSIGSKVHNRSLTKIGTIEKINSDMNTYQIKWEDGNTSKHWHQELINVEAKHLIRK